MILRTTSGNSEFKKGEKKKSTKKRQSGRNRRNQL